MVVIGALDYLAMPMAMASFKPIYNLYTICYIVIIQFQDLICEYFPFNNI